MLHKLLAGHRSHIRSILSIMLCLALVCGTVASMSVFAAEPETAAETAVEETSTENTAGETTVTTETSTEAPTEAATETLTETPTEAATEGTTESGTETSTELGTEAVTEGVTENTNNTDNTEQSVTEATSESVTEEESRIETETESQTKEEDTEEEIKYPAFSDTRNLSEGISVSVSAEEGILPEGTTMTVTLLDPNASATAAQYSEAEAALANSGVSYDGMIAVDISFQDMDGNEIEPEQGSVTVRINVDSSLLDEDIDKDSLAVQHLAETDSGLVVETVADAGTVTDAAVETSANGDVSTEFTVESFSYFTLTYNNSNSLTIYLVGEDGNDILGSDSLGTTSGSNSWTSIEDAAEDFISQAEGQGYVFDSAHLGSYDSSTTVTYIKYYSSTSIFGQSGWRYSSATSTPSGNGTSIENNAIYLVFTGDGGSGGTGGGTVTDISPAYSKYVADNGGDTYDLTLTVTGGISTTEEKAKIDIIYVLDVSGSMQYGMSSNSNANRGSRRLDYANSAITTLTNSLANNNDLDVRYALVTFSGSTGDGTYNDATTVQTWTSSASTLTNALPSSATGGTNYQAGLMNAATLLNSARDGAITVVVFVSDGDPSYYYNTQGNTTGSGNSYDATAMSNAQSQLASMSMNYFISVGVGIESNYTRLQTLNSSAASGVTTAFYAGTDSTSLQNAFSAIQSLITTYAFSNVTVTDTLSENVTIVTNASGSVDLTITVTDKDGTVQASGVGSVTLSDETVITASYDSSSKTITLNFPDTYELEDGWTYSVTATVEASDKAYENYQTNDGYTDTGDAGTDAPNVSESNYISSGKAGVYTNSSATLTYTYNNVENTVEYPKPVIPLKFGTLVIEKTIEGLDDAFDETLEALKDTLTFSYTLNSGTANSVTLGDFTYDEATGKYLYTISGLKAGTTYTVTESGADSLTSYGYRLDTTATNSDTNEESGTIAKDTTSTASFTNVYVPAEQTVTITKIVDGNMGDTTKNFSFTLTLVDSEGTSYAGSLLAKKSSSETEFYLEVGDYSFTLTNEETITIKVPYGYTLTVIESDDNSGYTTTVAVDGVSATSGKTWSGSITADTSIVYTNSKEAIPDTGINLDSAPYIAMLIAVALFGSVTMIYRRRRLL